MRLRFRMSRAWPQLFGTSFASAAFIPGALKITVRAGFQWLKQRLPKPVDMAGHPAYEADERLRSEMGQTCPRSGYRS